jgi:hypothetical protein
MGKPFAFPFGSEQAVIGAARADTSVDDLKIVMVALVMWLTLQSAFMFIFSRGSHNDPPS